MGFRSFFKNPVKSIGNVLGGGSSGNSTNQVSTKQDIEIKNDITVDNNISFDELAEAQKTQTELDYKLFEYSKEYDKVNLTLEQQNEAEKKAISIAQLEQDREALNQSRLNTQITTFFAVVGLILTLWKFKKGKS